MQKNNLTSLNDFKPFSIKTYKELHKGMILYNGYCSFEVLSDIFYDKDINALFVEVLKTYNDDGFSIKTSLFLGDNNITNGGYNPWMLFTDKEIASIYSEKSWIVSKEIDIITGESEYEFKELPTCETLSKTFIIEHFKVKSSINF